MRRTRRVVGTALILLPVVAGGLPPRGLSEEPWSAPTALIKGEQRLASPIVLSDSAGGVHVFFTLQVAEKNAQNNAIMYMHQLGDAAWSHPVAVMTPEPERPLVSPSMALDGHGWLHVVYQGPRVGQIEYRRVHLSRLTDPQGWSRPARLSEGGGFGSAVTATPDGKVHVLYASRKHHVFYQRSDDGGRTWSHPIQVSAGDPKQQGCDVPRLAVDGRGRIHAVWSQAYLPAGWPPVGVFYSRSLDGGATWSRPLKVAGDNYWQCSIATRGDDEVHVAWNAVVAIGDRRHQWSRDGGETWSAPELISRRISGGITGAPALALDSGGTLHLVTSVNGPKRIEQIFHLTWDGSAWSEPQLISAGTEAENSVEFPCLAIGGGNRLYVVYEGDYRRLWFTEGRSASPPLAPRPVPTVPTGLLYRLAETSLPFRLLLAVILLFVLQGTVQMAWRVARRVAR